MAIPTPRTDALLAQEAAARASVQLPSHIVLLPHTIELCTDAQTVNNCFSDGVRGDCDPERLRMRINTAYPHSVQASTVFHELVHLMIAHSGVKDMLDHDAEERICNSLAPMLVNFVRDNHVLVEWLQSTP